MKHLGIKFILASFHNPNEFYFRISTNKCAPLLQSVHFSKIIISVSQSLDICSTPCRLAASMCDKLGDLPICLTCPYSPLLFSCFPLLCSILPRFSIFAHLYVILFLSMFPLFLVPGCTRLCTGWSASPTPAVSLSLSHSLSLFSPPACTPLSHLPQAFSLPSFFPSASFPLFSFSPSPRSVSLPFNSPSPLLCPSRSHSWSLQKACSSFYFCISTGAASTQPGAR